MAPSRSVGSTARARGGALSAYREKRQFERAPEPEGKAGRAEGNRFVVQKQAARRLHYDLRLELDGVLKSWAMSAARVSCRTTSVWRSTPRITRSNTSPSRG